MDISELFNNVKNVDDYISVTQDINDKYKDLEIKLNITTVLALKSLKSLEVECLNKSYENGAATIIFGRLLALPPSRIWRELAKEMVGILQYWLEAIRKYMIHHTVDWWSFLRHNINFINELSTKNVYMPNILVQMTAECLIDVVTREAPDPHQRYIILHCLNNISAKATRETRIDMHRVMAGYFGYKPSSFLPSTKLSRVLCTTGYLPTQHGALEALLRWLVERKSKTARVAAANMWFPPDICPEAARNVFLGTDWTINFYKDARDFLNALNETNGLVTSVLCKWLAIGNVIVISGKENYSTWVDINIANKSLTIFLEPRVLRLRNTVEALRIPADSTDTAQLVRLSEEIRLLIHTYTPPSLSPSDVTVVDSCDVTIILTSKTDVTKLDSALREVFEDKYHMLSDFDNIPHSPLLPTDNIRSEYIFSDEATMPRPLNVKRKCLGSTKSIQIRPPKNIGGLVSPSTASTSSLAQLHEKLEALPKAPYTRVHPKVISVEPDLSNVMELSESDDRSFQSRSTLKLKQSGVRIHVKKKAESDSEYFNAKSARCLSPVDSNDSSASCLLVATIGSTDESVINDTIERISKHKDFNNENIVDLLVQEAFQAQNTAQTVNDANCHITVKDIGNNNEVIENTPNERDYKKTLRQEKLDAEIKKKKGCTVVSKSTTDDESNTEAIIDTPVLDTMKKSKQVRKNNATKLTQSKLPGNRLTNYFESRIQKDSKETNVIPDKPMSRNNSMAIKEQFDENEVMECLKHIIDQVCNAEICIKYIERNSNDTTSADHRGNTPSISTKGSEPNQKNIKLTYNIRVKKENSSKSKEGSKIQSQPKKESKSTVKRSGKVRKVKTKNIEEIICKTDSPMNIQIQSVAQENDNETPQIKRKRKLYSPKDELLKEKKGIMNQASDDEDLPLAEVKYNNRKKLDTANSVYSDIEKEHRQRPIRTRSKKKHGKEQLLSPGTLKINDAFDRVKAIESNEEITVVNKVSKEIYNFTSDSEDDEDFVKKKKKIKKVTSTSTIGSYEPTKAKRYGRQKTEAKTNLKSSNEKNKKPKPSEKKKLLKKTSRSKTNLLLKPIVDLVDEKMREAGSDVLNTSVVVEKPKATISRALEPKLKEPPQMEPLDDVEEIDNPEIETNKKTTKSDRVAKKNKLIIESDKEGNKTLSPLPSLVVESVLTRENDNDDTVLIHNIQTFLENYHDNSNVANESSNIQNILMDNERSVNITDDISFHDYRKEIIEKEVRNEKTEKKKRSRNDEEMDEFTDKKRLKADTSCRKDALKAIEKFNIDDWKSEESINTDGITGHGEIDESPPSPEMISKCMEPREIEDMNESMKDYFVNLNRHINASFKENSVKTVIQKEDNSSLRSPVVSIPRLSDDDIRRWMPSRRTSETDSSSIINQTPKSPPHTETNLGKKLKIIPEKAKSPDVVPTQNRATQPKLDSSQESSPAPTFSNISYEEFQILQPLRRIPKCNSKVSSLQQFDSQKGLKHMYNTRQMAKTLNLSNENNPEQSIQHSDRSTISKKKVDKVTKAKTSKSAKGKYVRSEVDDVITKTKLDDTNPKTRGVKILISPVKSFVNDANKSDNEDFVQTNTRWLSKHLSEPKTIQSTSTKHKTQSFKTTENITLKRDEVNDSTNKNDTVTSIEVRSPILVPKKSRVEDRSELATLESGPSVASVTDWFRRINESSPSGGNESNVLLNDTIHNVLEKVDTTLVEINHNTSKQLVQLFMDTQMQLTDQKKERRKLCINIANEIMTDLAKKLEVLNEKYQEMDAKFMADLKKRAFELVSKDCKQKQAMVRILKQDVQAVAEHLKKKGG